MSGNGNGAAATGGYLLYGATGWPVTNLQRNSRLLNM